MTDTSRSISVAEVKRRFSDILGAVRYRHERFIIERNGTPVAALVPLEDLNSPPEPKQRSGFLALVGAFSDAPGFPELLEDAAQSRGTQRSRPAPRLDT
jgi:prevent-host-death family protein